MDCADQQNAPLPSLDNPSGSSRQAIGLLNAPHLAFWQRLWPGYAKRISQQVRQQAMPLRNLTTRELQSVSADVRERVVGDRAQGKSLDFSSSRFLVPTMALAFEAVRRTVGYELHDVQLQAAQGLLANSIVEMQTGEGKTLAAFPAAVFLAFAGEGVHVSTPNRYLAQRDCEQLQPAFEALGVHCGLLPEYGVQPEQAKSAAYDCDVTYGPGYEFGFDYLRDQVKLLAEEELALGVKTQRRMAGQAAEHQTHMRKLAAAIVDEADHVLIDDASSPLVLSEAKQGEAPDSEALLLAKRVAGELQQHRDFVIRTSAHIELNESALERIHSSQIPIPVHQLIRPWASYVTNALAARYCFRRGVEYVMNEDTIKLVDQSTGRIFEDRTWDLGIHQAVEVKEGLPPTPDTLPLAQITRQRFYQRYKTLAGMTGTAMGCKSELRKVYGLETCVIAPRVASLRKQWRMRAFVDATTKWTAIAASVGELQGLGRPVLVGTNTIADSLSIAEHLKHAGISFELLNGCQDAEEASIIARAGRAGAVTIATNMAGRGTDIRLTDSALKAGGLHVIVSECHPLSRVDRQLVGRCARQGDPGSAQAFLSADDSLLVRHAPWLGESIRRIAGQLGEISSDLTGQVGRIQNAVEEEHFFARLELLKD